MEVSGIDTQLQRPEARYRGRSIAAHEPLPVIDSRGDPAGSIDGVPSIHDGGGSAGNREGVQGGGTWSNEICGARGWI